MWNIASAITYWRSFLFSICFLFTQPQELLLCCNDSRCKVFFTAFVGSWVFSLVLNLIPCAPRAGEEKVVQLMTTFYILLSLLQIATKTLSLEISYMQIKFFRYKVNPYWPQLWYKDTVLCRKNADNYTMLITRPVLTKMITGVDFSMSQDKSASENIS